MRPAELDSFFASVRSLPGVGPKVAALVTRAVGADEEAVVRDLLFHLPVATIDRRVRPPLHTLPHSGVVTVLGRVERHSPPPPGSKAPWRVVLGDGKAAIQLIYFSPRADWLEKLYPIGAERLVSGPVEWFDMRPQMPHPDYVLPPERAHEMPGLEPVYGLTEGLSSKVLTPRDRGGAGGAARTPGMDFARSGRRAWLAVLRRRRSGRSTGRRKRRMLCRRVRPGQRLAFDELLASQLALMLVRGSLTRGRGTAWSAPGRLRGEIEAALPFALTASQRQALARDRSGPRRREPHAPAAAGRRRLRQDHRRAPRHGACRGGRRPDGADGADRTSCPPAFRDDRAARRGGRHRDRPPHRQGRRGRPQRSPGADRRWLGRHRRRHACAVPGRRRVSTPRPRRRRRAAPFRRAPAPGAVRQGRGARRARR